MDKPAFDLGAEMERINAARDIARRLGAATLATQVHGWMVRHAGALPVEAMRELNAILFKAAE